MSHDKVRKLRHCMTRFVQGGDSMTLPTIFRVTFSILDQNRVWLWDKILIRRVMRSFLSRWQLRRNQRCMSNSVWCVVIALKENFSVRPQLTPLLDKWLSFQFISKASNKILNVVYLREKVANWAQSCLKLKVLFELTTFNREKHDE